MRRVYRILHKNIWIFVLFFFIFVGKIKLRSENFIFWDYMCEILTSLRLDKSAAQIRKQKTIQNMNKAVTELERKLMRIETKIAFHIPNYMQVSSWFEEVFSRSLTILHIQRRCSKVKDVRRLSKKHLYGPT